MCGPGLVGRRVSGSCVCVDLALLVGGFLVPVCVDLALLVGGFLVPVCVWTWPCW